MRRPFCRTQATIPLDLLVHPLLPSLLREAKLPTQTLTIASSILAPSGAMSRAISSAERNASPCPAISSTVPVKAGASTC